jgi:hypothetical protein
MKAPDLALKNAWREQGYVIVRQAMDKERVQFLSESIDEVLEQAHHQSGGADFQWINEAARIPSFISGLLGMRHYQPAFGEFLDEVAIPFIEELLESPVRCGWMMMLSAGGGVPYEISLHRDNSAIGDPEEERAAIARLENGSCYLQAALYPDDFLYVVPGSHARVATKEELKGAELEQDFTGIAGIVKIALEPGDVIFRHTNTLHGGYNPQGLPRRTLVSGLWAEALPMLDIERQDHALIGEAGFVERLPGRCRSAAERYLARHDQDMISP